MVLTDLKMGKLDIAAMERAFAGSSRHARGVSDRSPETGATLNFACAGKARPSWEDGRRHLPDRSAGRRALATTRSQAMKRIVLQMAAALALASVAVPALACGEKATTTASEKSDKKPSASTEKAPAKAKTPAS